MTVLRVALGLAWAGITAGMLLSPRVGGPGTVALAAAAALVLAVAMFAVLRHAPRDDRSALTLVLVAVQVVAGILLATDYMFLVAIELPLVLRTRQAVPAFFVVVSLVMVVGFAEARYGVFFAAPELAGMPWNLQVIITMVMTAGWLTLAFAGGLLAATEARARVQLARLTAELRLADDRLAEASREAERLRIARELHDTVGHRLAALAVSLDLESRRAPGATAAALGEARDATQQLLDEVRQVVSALRVEPDVDLKRGLVALAQGVAPLEVVLTVSPGFELRDPAASHALLRCAQEALTNVLRHARTGRVALDLRQSRSGVLLAVRDAGAGASAVREGNGLRGMRERLTPLGGTLEWASQPERGFELRAWIPARSAGA